VRGKKGGGLPGRYEKEDVERLGILGQGKAAFPTQGRGKRVYSIGEGVTNYGRGKRDK